jgi:S1-C subfamily serine protease
VWVLAPLVIAAALVAGRASTWGRSPSTTAPDLDRTVQTAVDKATTAAANAPARSALVYRAIAPSLVVIRTERPAADQNPDEAESGIGAGVVVNADGTILTANHVVADADTIEVTFADGTTANGEILAQDATKDTAVLKTDRKPEVVVPAVLGGGVNIGDETFAVGNPLGLLSSLSAGVVSGLNRSVPLKNGSTLAGLIQFDAAVNPGNSGGPLLNRNGQVVGIVTGLANPAEQGFFVGIGFAVPIATAGGGAGGPPQ